jgi:hypothetical protein
MVELCGKRYIIDYCIASLKKKRENKAFKTYVTDALKAIADNTAGGEQRHYMSVRWVEMIEPQIEPEKSPEEQAAEIIAHMKKVITGNGRI